MQRSTRETLSALLAVIIVALARAWPLVSCDAPCMVDFSSWEGADQPLLHLSYTDTRLNAWILAWVQHAITTAPLSLFDANIFHPTRDILAGSEHLFGLALPLLPLRLFTDDPMRIHQIALVLGFVGTGLTTFALTHWLTGSPWAAFVGGAAAALMPWRLTELSHLQLVSTTWIPLVWLLTARTLVEGAQPMRTLVLSIVVGLQILTSYYLAYALLVSAAVLMLVLLVVKRPSLAAWRQILIAYALPLLLLVALSIPYLRAINDTLVLRGPSILSVPLSLAWAQIAPPLALSGSTMLPFAARYEIPLVIALLALASIGGGRFAIAFWGIALAGFVLSLGRDLELGGATLPLPARLLGAIVPGFDELRAPLRWGILVGLVIPVLAALGAHRIERAAVATSSVLAPAVRVSLVLLFAAGIVAPPLLTAPEFSEIAGDLAIYDSLRRQPPGPVLEVPWRRDADRDALLAGEYMLASTRHWRPLLNGYTGHPPRDYEENRLVGQMLPAPDALDVFIAEAGLRWIVVHRGLLTAQEAEAWDFAPMSGRLAVVDQRGDARIYEVLPK